MKYINAYFIRQLCKLEAVTEVDFDVAVLQVLIYGGDPLEFLCRFSLILFECLHEVQHVALVFDAEFRLELLRAVLCDVCHDVLWCKVGVWRLCVVSLETECESLDTYVIVTFVFMCIIKRF